MFLFSARISIIPAPAHRVPLLFQKMALLDINYQLNLARFGHCVIIAKLLASVHCNKATSISPEATKDIHEHFT